MTRNREIDLEDLTGCDHSPEVAVSNEQGGVDHWICRCGQRADPSERTKLISVADRWGYEKVLREECPCCKAAAGVACEGSTYDGIVHKSRSDAAPKGWPSDG